MCASEFWPKDNSFGTMQNLNILYPIELEPLWLNHKGEKQSVSSSYFGESYFILFCNRTSDDM